MLLIVDIIAKTIGERILFRNLRFAIEPKQKIAVIGRNGVGKTTLFRIIAGKDKNYEGLINLRKGAVVVTTAQEHHAAGQQTVMEYALENLPEYSRLKHIIDTYPDHMENDMKKLTVYSDALERFGTLGYFYVEEALRRSLENYQITAVMASLPMSQLSGGQKRFVELARVEHAQADLALIDEPTNHMDFVAKAMFIEWLMAADQGVLVITHDRDVLAHVDRIIEIKDGAAYSYSGNYDAYLKQNTTDTAADIHDYEVAIATLANLHKKIMWARARKPSWHGTADQRNPFEVMERRLQREYDALQASTAKPSFWIDRESAGKLNKKVGESYQKFKAKNIRMRHSKPNEHGSVLMQVENLSLGYNGQPLFKSCNFSLRHEQKLQLVGRNGSGKTTLVKAITMANRSDTIPTLLHGQIICSPKLRLSVYEQELAPKLLDVTVAQAIEQYYDDAHVQINDQKIKQLLSDYLFDPQFDGSKTVRQLSGGQKARLQIIKMLASNPNLLILDEPTNHLDLPSIEELEDALQQYSGAVLYITHDSYFARNLGGETIGLEAYSGPS